MARIVIRKVGLVSIPSGVPVNARHGSRGEPQLLSTESTDPRQGTERASDGDPQLPPRYLDEPRRFGVSAGKPDLLRTNGPEARPDVPAVQQAQSGISRKTVPAPVGRGGGPIKKATRRPKWATGGNSDGMQIPLSELPPTDSLRNGVELHSEGASRYRFRRVVVPADC